MKPFIFAVILSVLVLRTSQQDSKYANIDQTMIDLVQKNGYPIETHEVITEDDYILSVFRIPHGKNSNKTGKPLILQHGIFCSSAGWAIGNSSQALAFILADNGYDVWLTNSRGSTYGRKHVYLDPDLEADKPYFWNFTFHEIGHYDLPASIDYVLNATEQDSLYYVGHSQGTTIFFVMASTRPEYNAKVKHMSALAPVANLHHARGGLKVLAYNRAFLTAVAKTAGWYSILEKQDFISYMGKMTCRYTGAMASLCTNVLNLVSGFDMDEFNQDLIPDISSYTPAGASVKQLLHFSQLVRNVKNQFTYYDYGEYGNMQLYNQKTAPEYDLSKVTARVVLHNGNNDLITVPTDIKKLHQSLPNSVLKPVPFRKFNHLDFMWATHGYELLYKDVLEEMAKY